MESILTDLAFWLDASVRKIRVDMTTGKLTQDAGEQLVAQIAETGRRTRALVLAAYGH